MNFHCTFHLYQFHYSATNDVQIQYVCKIRISKVCPTLHSLSYALKTSKVTNNKVQEDFLWPKSSSWEMIKLDLFPMAVGIKTMASAVHCHFHWLALNFLFACWTSSRDAASGLSLGKRPIGTYLSPSYISNPILICNHA